MSNVLTRVSIPYRLREEFMLKEGTTFDVPRGPKGMEFMAWWEKAGSDKRDALMRQAYNNNMAIVDAYTTGRTNEEE